MNRKVEYNNGKNIFEIKFFTKDRAEFDETLSIVKNLHGRKFNPNSKIWTAPPIKQNIDILKNSDFSFVGYANTFLDIEEKKITDIVIDEKKLEKLRGYQIEGIKFLEMNNGNAIIGDEMGLGKTVQALGYLKIHPELKPALIICPATLKENWKREYLKWNEFTFNFEILSGKSIYLLKKDLDFVIINYDIISDWQDYLIKYKFKVIIADEIQYIANRKANRTRAFKKIVKSIDKKIFLSGTPINNRPVEFFTALNLQNKELFNSEFIYKQKYCCPYHNGFGWTYKGLSNGDELFSLIKTIMIRRKKIDVLKELPEKIRNVIPLAYDKNKKTFEIYKNLETAFKGMKNAKKIDKQNHIERMKQISYELKRNAVMKWIKDFLEENKKLVVFATHTAVIDDLIEEFKNECVFIDGRVKMTERQNIVDRFQNDENIKLFIGQIRAAGIGLTLTAADTTCFIELGWTPGEHVQAEDRVHRIGQTSDSVNAYYLVAADTIEDRIMNLLQEKFDILSQVLDGEKNKEFFDSSILELIA